MINAVQYSLSSVANGLFGAGIITRDVLDKPSYDSFVGNFLAGLNFKKAQNELEKHCSLFLKALAYVGGPVAEASQGIKEEWIKGVNDELGIELQLDF